MIFRWHEPPLRCSGCGDYERGWRNVGWLRYRWQCRSCGWKEGR